MSGPRRVLRMQRKPSGPAGAFETFSLTVPTDIAVLLREHGVRDFIVELNEDGLLYRPVKAVAKTDVLPSWLTEAPE